MKTLKQRVADAVAAGYTVGGLATAAGVSSAAASHWSTGKTKSLKGTTATGLAKATGWSALWWATGKGERGSAKGPPLPPGHLALPVVFDLIAGVKPEARQELRALFPLLLETDSPLYRQRFAQLLGAEPPEQAGK